MPSTIYLLQAEAVVVLVHLAFAVAEALEVCLPMCLPCSQAHLILLFLVQAADLVQGGQTQPFLA
jgi:hypothetical protein